MAANLIKFRDAIFRYVTVGLKKSTNNIRFTYLLRLTCIGVNG